MVDERGVWFLVGGAGVVGVAVGVFLPRWDAGSVVAFHIERNSVIQSTGGWVPLLLAAFAGMGMVRAFQRGSRSWAPFVDGLLVLLYAVYDGTAREARTLCPPGATSLQDPGCQVAAPGIGVFVMGLGAIALIVAGCVLARRPSTPAPSRAAVRECPFCREAMRRDASTCPHCRKESRPWVYRDGAWWMQATPDGVWLKHDEETGGWIKPRTREDAADTGGG